MYFQDPEQGENCCSLEYYKHYLRLGQLENPLRLVRGVRSDIPGLFWCKSVWALGAKGECGNCCTEYAPRNGKSGACKHFGFLYERDDSEVLELTLLDSGVVKTKRIEPGLG